MVQLIPQLKQKNPDLKEAELIGLLYLLKNKAPFSNGDFIRFTGLPKETLKTFKESIKMPFFIIIISIQKGIMKILRKC